MSGNGSSSLERVKSEAERLGLPIEIRTMDQSTRTAEEAAAACGCDVGQIVKSLIFEDATSGHLVLLLVSGRHNVDLDLVATKYGVRLQRADARRVRDETGFAIGGVAPIGHLNSPAVHLDETLLAFPVVWCAAGRPDSVFSISPKMLSDAIGARIIAVTAA